MSEQSPWSYDSEDDLFRALDRGAADLPPEIGAKDEVIAAAGVWGPCGSVVVLRRDEEDGSLLDDTYLLRVSSRGRWESPDSSSGSGMPDWVLHRPDEAIHDPVWAWSGGGLICALQGQVSQQGGVWLADLTMMAATRVARLDVQCGGRRCSVAVPVSGLVTLPLQLVDSHVVARVAGFDAEGHRVAEAVYQPLTEVDRGWPDPSFWQA